MLGAVPAVSVNTKLMFNTVADCHIFVVVVRAKTNCTDADKSNLLLAYLSKRDVLPTLTFPSRIAYTMKNISCKNISH